MLHTSIRFPILRLSAVAALALQAFSADAADLVLRFHHMLPAKATIVEQAMLPWAKAVEEQSGGRIDIEFYHGMQLGGKPQDIADQVARGDVELGWTVLGYTQGRYPKSEAFELPFMVSNAETGSAAFQRFYEKDLKDEFKDVHVIAVHVHGPGVLHTRPGVEVRGAADLKDLKVRGASRMVNTLLEASGATPVIMAVTSVPDGLTSGFIDGAVMPWEVWPSVDDGTRAPVHTELATPKGAYTATFMLAMNKKTYEGLPADLKAVLDANSGEMAARLFGRAMDEGDRLGREKAIAAGNTFITISPEETARFVALGEQVTKDWIARMNALGHDGEGLVKDAVGILASLQTQ